MATRVIFFYLFFLLIKYHTKHAAFNVVLANIICCRFLDPSYQWEVLWSHPHLSVCVRLSNRVLLFCNFSRVLQFFKILSFGFLRNSHDECSNNAGFSIGRLVPGKIYVIELWPKNLFPKNYNISWRSYEFEFLHVVQHPQKQKLS